MRKIYLICFLCDQFHYNSASRRPVKHLKLGVEAFSLLFHFTSIYCICF